MAAEHPPVDLLHPLDLLTPGELQALQDSLAAVTGLYVSLSTPAGQPLTRRAPLPPVCALLSHGACREPDLQCGFASGRWRRLLAESERPCYERCPRCGLQLAGMPLRVRGRLLATLVCGRAPAAALEEGWLREQAASLHVDEGELRAALEAMPAVDNERFQGLVAHAWADVQGLASLAEARLAGQQSRRALELTNHRSRTLGAIGAAVIRSATWQESLGQALQTILDVLHLESGAIFVQAEAGGAMRLLAHRGVSPEFAALADGELVQRAASKLFQGSGEPWVVADAAAEPALPCSLLQELQIGAFVAVPLCSQGILGALLVYASRPRPFEPDEVALIGAAGEQLAIGLQGLRLLEAEKRRAGELAILNEVAVAVGGSLDLQVIVEQALAAAVRSFGANAGLIYLQEEGSETPVLAAQHGLSDEVAALWREKPPVGWSPEVGPDSHVCLGTNVASGQASLALAEGLAPYASVVLRGQRRNRGLLVLFTREPRTLLANEIELFQAVAHQIGLALENAGLYREAQRRLGDLEALQHFNERILHTMQEGIFIVSLRGRISYATPRLAELSGQGVSELIGSDWLALARPEEHEGLREVLRSALEGRSMRTEFDLRCANGESRHVSLGAVPLSDGDTVTGMLGVASDLTEEAHLRRRLRQAEKLSAIGELVSGVAHELNNPLTVIRGYAQLLQGQEELVDGSRELAAISEHAERAARIVQELLTFARERPASHDVVDLGAVLQSVLDQRERAMAAAGIRAVRELAPGLPRLRGDPYQLQQVFLNIVINAEQALAEAGDDRQITVSTSLDPGGMLLGVVRDNGPGIPAGVADRVFDPFFTTKGDRQGTGLGLAICYGIVHAHGGRIWAESVAGQGATFYVALPLPGEPLPEPARAQVRARPGAGGHLILVLEDEVEIARLVARYLERLGYRVIVRHDAAAALEAIAEESPDLLLTDLKMPGMSGREFYAALCKRQPELAARVVFVTGDTVSPDTQAFLRQTGRPHLAKPFSLDEVRSLLEETLGSGQGA